MNCEHHETHHYLVGNNENCILYNKESKFQHHFAKLLKIYNLSSP